MQTEPNIMTYLTKPSLDSLETVTFLLQEYVSHALSRRAQYLALDFSSEQALEFDMLATRALSNLLYGQGPHADNFQVHPWNSPEQMGAALKQAYDMDYSEKDVVFYMLLSMLAEIYSTIDRITLEKRLDGNEWLFDGIIEIYATAFCGLPWDDGEG